MGRPVRRASANPVFQIPIQAIFDAACLLVVRSEAVGPAVAAAAPRSRQIAVRIMTDQTRRVLRLSEARAFGYFDDGVIRTRGAQTSGRGAALLLVGALLLAAGGTLYGLVSWLKSRAAASASSPAAESDDAERETGLLDPDVGMPFDAIRVNDGVYHLILECSHRWGRDVAADRTEIERLDDAVAECTRCVTEGTLYSLYPSADGESKLLVLNLGQVPPSTVLARLASVLENAERESGLTWELSVLGKPATRRTELAGLPAVSIDRIDQEPDTRRVVLVLELGLGWEAGQRLPASLIARIRSYAEYGASASLARRFPQARIGEQGVMIRIETHQRPRARQQELLRAQRASLRTRGMDLAVLVQGRSFNLD